MNGSDFLCWWRSQLIECVPAPLRARLHQSQTTLTLRVDGHQLALGSSATDEVATVTTAAGAGDSPPAGFAEFLARLPRKPQQVRLELAPEEFLQRSLSLPRAARANLVEAVGYQLPQLMPFDSDDLLFACGELPNPPDDGPLPVWLVAVPRGNLGRWLRLIGQAQPDNPLPVRSPPGPGEPLVIAWRLPGAALLPGRWRRLAWVGLLLLWVGLLALHLHRQQLTQESLDLALAELRSRAVEVSRLQDRLLSSQSQLDQLGRLKASAPSTLALLDQLTQRLDDDTWLQGLELRGRQLTLRGLSSSPATLIETLEATPLLERVRFGAAIRHDGRAQVDRFNISARLSAGKEDDGT